MKFSFLVLANVVLLGASASVLAQQPSSPAGCEGIIRGKVKLKVELLASGKVGDVTIVSGGIPKQLEPGAIEAAKSIKFEPKMVNGVPVDNTAMFAYTYDLSFEENSPDLQKNAEITKLPQAKFPKNITGYEHKKIAVELALLADGKLEVVKVSGDVPQDFKDAAAKAARRIEFKPAIHKCGQPVWQDKIIEFEIK